MPLLIHKQNPLVKLGLSEESWKTEPKWFQTFYLFDKDRDQITKLNALVAEHSDRRIQVHKGDSNQMLRSVLPVGFDQRRGGNVLLVGSENFPV